MTLNAIFSLKLENNEILPILSVAILKIKINGRQQNRQNFNVL
jgi:hypothetical protein